MNKIGIIFGIFAFLVVVFVFQYFFPKAYNKLPIGDYINFGPLMRDDGSNNGDNKDISGGEEDDQSSPSSSSSNINPAYQGPRPETKITFGPNEGEQIRDNIEVVFRFSGTLSGESEGISFETKISGVDEDWVGISGNERKINLLPGDYTYNFQVRAKHKDIVDLTPASRSFRGIFSQYFDKVGISSVSPSSFPRIMRLSLRNNSEGLINVNNWKIKGLYGAMTIPQAVNLYDQFSASHLNQDIALDRGDEINIFGESSPIGANFRLNKCTGYLNNTYNFSDSPPNNCPRPSQYELSSLRPACREYLSSLGACREPDPTKLNSFSGDSTCRSFTDSHFNYSSCVRNYQNNVDFFSDIWYVFSGRTFIGSDNDRLELYDQQNLLVSSYEY